MLSLRLWTLHIYKTSVIKAQSFYKASNLKASSRSLTCWWSPSPTGRLTHILLQVNPHSASQEGLLLCLQLCAPKLQQHKAGFLRVKGQNFFSSLKKSAKPLLSLQSPTQHEWSNHPKRCQAVISNVDTLWILEKDQEKNPFCGWLVSSNIKSRNIKRLMASQGWGNA